MPKGKYVITCVHDNTCTGMYIIALMFPVHVSDTGLEVPEGKCLVPVALYIYMGHVLYMDVHVHVHDVHVQQYDIAFCVGYTY